MRKSEIKRLNKLEKQKELKGKTEITIEYRIDL